MKTEFYQDDAGKWRWRTVAENNEIVAASSQGFASEGGAIENYKLCLSLPLLYSGEDLTGERAHHLEEEVRAVKELRKALSDLVPNIKGLPGSRERSLSLTNLQQSVMWLGMDLGRMNQPNPYPNSKDSSNAKIDPTAEEAKGLTKS